MNIPIYRAKKIDNNEYVEGFYYKDGKDHIIFNGDSTTIFGLRVIDSTTLAIHFPDMIDSQGNKLFASLSEDGKGGDIVDTTIGLRQNFVTICLSSGVCVFTSDTSAIKNTPCKFILDYKHRGIKVVGIQKDIK